MANARLEIEIELNKLLIDKVVELASQNNELSAEIVYLKTHCPRCGGEYGRKITRPIGAAICRLCGSDILPLEAKYATHG